MQREQVTARFPPHSAAYSTGPWPAACLSYLGASMEQLSSGQSSKQLRDKLLCTPIQTAHAHPLLAGACRVGIALHVQDAVVPHRLGSNGL